MQREDTMKTYLYTSPSFDGYENLARDEYLLNTLGKDDLALYFYINRSAVILGKNQYQWTEVDNEKICADKVQLVRRITGGGAVYHDMGNLNYSFIAGKNRYDIDAQRELIRKALAAFGIEAQATGRNDLTVNGHKFSGTAYCTRSGVHQSHGTLLVNVDRDAMSKYLSPSKLKLQSNGVKSVRSRVCGLSEFSADITVEKLRKTLETLFVESYGPVIEPVFDENELNLLVEKHCSAQWVMDTSLKSSYQAEARLSAGTVQLSFSVSGSGVIDKVKFYTDAMDYTLPERVEPVLTGVKYDKKAIVSALSAAGFDELAAWAEAFEL